MKRVLQPLRTTFVGGLLFLVPVVVLAVILQKALAFAHKLVAPLAAQLPDQLIFGWHTPRLLSVGLIVLICFIAGLFARTAIARKIVGALEAKVLSNLPGYQFLKSIGETALGVKPQEHWQAVLVHFDESWQLGILIERLDNGLLAVFVPGAPSPHSGSLRFMAPQGVKPCGIPIQPMMKCLKSIGAGSNALLGGVPIDLAAAKSH